MLVASLGRLDLLSLPPRGDTVAEVAGEFPDHSLDWVYIDAMHDYENVRADLFAFAPKVKPGGLIFGHDFSNNRISRRRNCGVVPAVLEFSGQGGFKLAVVTNENHPSYVLARPGPDGALRSLRRALLAHESGTLVEVAPSLFERYEESEFATAEGAGAGRCGSGSRPANGARPEAPAAAVGVDQRGYGIASAQASAPARAAAEATASPVASATRRRI